MDDCIKIYAVEMHRVRIKLKYIFQFRVDVSQLGIHDYV